MHYVHKIQQPFPIYCTYQNHLTAIPSLYFLICLPSLEIKQYPPRTFWRHAGLGCVFYSGFLTRPLPQVSRPSQQNVLWPEVRRVSFPDTNYDGAGREEKQHCGRLLVRPATADQRGCMGTKGRSEWLDLLLAYSARKIAFFTFLNAWFDFVSFYKWKKDGTKSLTDLPRVTQRVNGKAEERTHCTSV